MEKESALISSALAVVLEREGGELAYTQSEYAAVRAKHGDYVIQGEVDRSAPGEPVIRVKIKPTSKGNELRSQRAQGIEEQVLADSWGISRATVSRFTAGVTRTVVPGRTTQSIAAPRHAERNAAIRASSSSAADLAAEFDLSPSMVTRIRSGLPKTNRERFAQVAAGAWRADCMTDEEWSDWVAMNPMSVSGGDNAVAVRPCTDCPLGFAAEMRALGKCNGTPGWQAPAEDEPNDEEEEERQMTEPRIIPNGTEVAVTLEAPCPNCSHERVCGIKRSLDSIDTLPVTVPRLDKALSVVLTATVDCTEYSPVKKAKRTLNLSEEERQRRGARFTKINAERKAASA